MIIDLKAISHGTRRFEFQLEEDWWKSDGRKDQVVALDEPLHVTVEVYKAGERYVLDGGLKGRYNALCDRCLETYVRPIHHEFRVFLVTPAPDTETTEIELVEEDMEVGFIRGEEVDLDEIIREQIYLSLPFQSHCSENCRGLCPLCGRNLNRKDCGCERERGHPGLRKLKNLIT